MELSNQGVWLHDECEKRMLQEKNKQENKYSRAATYQQLVPTLGTTAMSTEGDDDDMTSV